MSFDSNDLRQRMSTSASELLSLAAEQVQTAKPSKAKPMSVMRAILGECMCEPFPFSDNRGLSQTSQFIELHGVECISLGAVVDELSPEQRIRETLEQLTAEPKRMISIGYLVDEETPKTSQIAVQEATKVTETVDLDVWRKNYPDDKNMSKPVAQTIKHIEVCTLVLNLIYYLQTINAHVLFLLHSCITYRHGSLVLRWPPLKRTWNEKRPIQQETTTISSLESHVTTWQSYISLLDSQIRHLPCLNKLSLSNEPHLATTTFKWQIHSLKLVFSSFLKNDFKKQ